LFFEPSIAENTVLPLNFQHASIRKLPENRGFWGLRHRTAVILGGMSTMTKLFNGQSSTLTSGGVNAEIARGRRCTRPITNQPQQPGQAHSASPQWNRFISVASTTGDEEKTFMAHGGHRTLDKLLSSHEYSNIGGKKMKKEQNIERLSFSVQEAASAIGVSSRMVHNFVKDGSIKHFRMGTRVLIPAEVLREFIAQRTQTQLS